MRKNLNSCHIEGYVYDSSKLEKKVTGPASKNPGTEFITGELLVATDEKGLNVVPVHFTYATATYSSGKTNNSYPVLEKIVANPQLTWAASGKENAQKVKIDGSLSLNDFYDKDDKLVSAKRCEGSFVSFTSTLKEENERNTFKCDILINQTNYIEKDEEKRIPEDYVSVKGATFDFRNNLLPMTFSVHNANGMKYFEDLGASASEPVYTKIWGKIVNQTVTETKSEESAFGEAAVTTVEKKNREWIITGTATVHYEFGDDNVMTEEELKEAVANRQVLLADIKKRSDEYRATQAEGKTKTATPSAAPTAAIPNKDFDF